ncbi:phosphodiesterase [Aggregicoccus sp. 17bor-14]|nr:MULTISPECIES: alkaline phosphatase family protein [Myxococcaceae]MBF5042582.1 alkaline phosphatase family protein [Simulacricoccus sp. 17bor-14]MRI88351.1 phosphodiesterase [Aggregicoccus sp. 17bor-14]
MPFLAGLVRSGAYHLERAFWGSPAATPAFQAGLLYGLRHPDLPGYSWFDRALGREVAMNHPQDTRAIEARLGRRSSSRLLEGGGHTYFSLFRGDAGNQLCMSTLGSAERMARGLVPEFRGVLAGRRDGALRAAGTLARETGRALGEVSRWARALGDWRHEPGFLVSRVLLQRLGWGFAHTKAVVDMARGVPLIYLVFGNYDETAHRRGPRSPLALAELQCVDASLADLDAVSRALEQPYDIVLVTDHGHVEAEPLEQRGGRRLAAALLEGPPRKVPPEVVRGLRDGRPTPVDVPGPVPGAPVVVEAGNFAHVYLAREPRPMEAEVLLAHFPEALGRALAHPDLAIVVLRRGEGFVAVVGGGVYGPDDVAQAPLSPGFSREALADLLRELPHMPNAGDLILYGREVGEDRTVGFAWEFGSHGGLTHTETDSLVCWPAHAPLDLRALSHASQLHERLCEVYRC